MMGTWISYTLVAGIILLALYLAYDWLLSGENQPRFNRVVLLSNYALAALLPLVDFSLIGNVKAAVAENEIGPISMLPATTTTDISTPVWPLILIAIYLIGAVTVAIMTIVANYRLNSLLKPARKLPCGRYTIAIVDDPSIAPFSWRRYIVMSSNDYRDNRDLIIIHETEHLDRCHRVDLLIARLFEIAIWYNPASWLMTAALRSVHEYEADRAVINHADSPRDYQMLLIKKAVGRSFPVLANSLNHSNLKKRITMMLKPNSSKSRRVRVLALIPAVAVALLSVNIPFMARALDTMSSADLTLNTTDKDSKNPAKEQHKPSTAKPGDEVNATGYGEQMSDTAPVRDNAEVMPQFPGGDAELMKFLADNIRFPESELNRTGKFTVVVAFTVGTDGKVRDAKIIRSQGEAFDAEALRVVNMLPAFTPGTTGGKPVAVSYTLPIRFATKSDKPAQQPK